jgi:hypothetical protein
MTTIILSISFFATIILISYIAVIIIEHKRKVKFINNQKKSTDANIEYTHWSDFFPDTSI